MRFPLASAYTALDCLSCHSWISEAKLEISVSLTSPPPIYWNNKVAGIATSCVMVWYGRGPCSCVCIRLTEPSEHCFRLCEHQKVFMKTSWARKFVFASQSRKIICMLFWGSKDYLFHCSHGSFLFWAMMWRDAHPIGLELGACLVLPTRYVFYSVSNLILFS